MLTGCLENCQNIIVVNLEENCILSKLGVNEQICSTARHFFHLDNLKRTRMIPKLLNCSLINKIEPKWRESAEKVYLLSLIINHLTCNISHHGYGDAFSYDLL